MNVHLQPLENWSNCQKNITCIVNWVKSECTCLNAFGIHYLHEYTCNRRPLKNCKLKISFLQCLCDKI